MEPTIQQQSKNKQLFQQTLELAHCFSEYLTSQGIDIWLEYGSALGAAREGGVIEGDTDMDLGIWWKDWDKFKNIIVSGEIPSSSPFVFNFRTNLVDGSGFFEGTDNKEERRGEMCKIQINDPTVELESKNVEAYHESPHIDIFGFEEYGDTKSSAIIYNKSFRSKLYYQKNLHPIKFDGLDFYVSKYNEKYLDYLYRDAGGEGQTWMHPVNNYDWITEMPSVHKQDVVTGYVEGVFDLFHKGHVRILKKAKSKFDKVYAAVTPDEIVRTYKNKSPILPFEDRREMLESCKYVDEIISASPTLAPTINWINANGIDYIAAGNNKENPMDEWYSEIIKENRLILLDETPDYHSSDLIKRILK